MSLNDWLDKGWLVKHRPDRKKRNISDYERVGAVSEHEAKEMLTLAKTLREKLTAWLKNNNPELV
jgi:hypothetical protein